MGRLTLVTFLAVLLSIFMETEANPFVYNYDRLRIGGLICAGLIIVGGIGIVVYNQCAKRTSRKSQNDSDI